MVESDDTGSNELKAVATGKGSLAINAAQYANVTVYQYVTYAGDKVTVRETADPSRCPYPGLETFRTSEATYFAGREDDVAELEAKLRDHNICGVIAASGAGKSSLVHAGLIPALAKHETEAWDVFAFKPGQEPLYGFARSMSGVLAEAKTRKGQFDEIDATVADLRETPGRLRRYIEDIISRRADAADGKHHRVLIFVDQWEELYTRENDDDRDILVRELMDVAERGLAKVLLTMRIDFMNDLVSKSTEFYDVLEPAVRILRPLSETGRRAAIEKPAEVAGLRVPPELTSRLIADLGKDEGTLPYLQFVLRQLWEKRDKETNSLTTATYDGMDGLKGAIGAHADDVFRKLQKKDPELASLAQRALPRLANVSETGAITSRRLPFADFDEPARELLRKLAEQDRRLITLSSATEEVAEAEIVAEVAHEALLDDWKTLYGWIADRKDFFRLRNKLEADAKVWVENKRNPEFLISPGKPLVDAQDLSAKANAGDLSEDLRRFILASVAKQKADQEQKEVRLVAQQRAEAERINREARQASEREALAHALSQTETKRANEAKAAETRLRTRNKLLVNVLGGLTLAIFLVAFNWLQAVEQRNVALGQKLAIDAQNVRSELGANTSTELASSLAIEAWRKAPSSRAFEVMEAALVELPTYHTDGQDLIYSTFFSTEENRIWILNANGLVQVYDTEQDDEPESFSVMSLGKDHYITSSSFTNTTQGLILAITTNKGEVLIFDLSNRAKLLEQSLDSIPTSVSVSSSGQYMILSTIDGYIKKIRISDNKMLIEIRNLTPASKVEISPGGDHFAVSVVPLIPYSSFPIVGTSFVKIYNANNGNETKRIPFSSEIDNFWFDEKGEFLIIASQYSVSKIFETREWTPLELPRHISRFHHAIIDGENRVVVASTGDIVTNTGSLHFVDLDDSTRNYSTFTGTASYALAFSPYDQSYLAGFVDGSTRIYDFHEGNELYRLKHADTVREITFNATGERALIVTDGSASIFEVRRPGQLRGGRFATGVRAATINPRSSAIATLDSENKIVVREFPYNNDDLVISIAGKDKFIIDLLVPDIFFLNEGQRVAFTADAGETRIWDIVSGEEIGSIQHQGNRVYLKSVSGSQDYFAVVTNDGGTTGRSFLEIVHVDLMKIVSTHEFVDNQSIWDVRFSDDDRFYVVGTDNGAEVYHTFDGSKVRSVTTGDWSQDVEFSPGSTRVAVGSDGLVVLVDLVEETEDVRFLHEGANDVRVNAMAFDPTGEKIVVGFRDGSAFLLDALSGEVINSYEFLAPVNHISFSRSGMYFSVMSRDGTIKVIDLQTSRNIATVGAAIHPGNGFGSDTPTYAFDPTSRFFAAAGLDNVVRVVDLQREIEVARFDVHAKVLALEYVDSGDKLLVVRGDGVEFLFDSRLSNLIDRLCRERVGRNLSKSEWQQYVGNQPEWSQTCSSWASLD